VQVDTASAVRQPGGDVDDPGADGRAAVSDVTARQPLAAVLTTSTTRWIGEAGTDRRRALFSAHRM
jgi:hypothetical protein